MENIIPTEVLIKIITSVGILITNLLLQKIFQRTIDKFVMKNGMSQTRNLTMHKIKTLSIHLVSIMGFIILWGVSFENAWVSIAGFIGLIAIGFFAVWSILSNIFAGVILFFYRPFKIEDHIEILPDGIHGKVQDINGFFVILCDEDGNLTHIPNNMIYQRVVRTYSGKK